MEHRDDGIHLEHTVRDEERAEIEKKRVYYHHVQIGSSGQQIASIECEYIAEVERLTKLLESRVTVAEEIERRRAAVRERDELIERLRTDGEEGARELLRLKVALDKGVRLVNEMDLRMPEQATEDADGWINSYRIPVGPWHRILGWARGEAQVLAGDKPRDEAKHD